MEENYAQLGAVAIIFVLAIREFFSWLKTRNGTLSDNKGNDLSQTGNDTSTLILQQLEKMNDNHLHSLEKAINEGNKEIVKAVSDGNREVASALGRIEGRLK